MIDVEKRFCLQIRFCTVGLKIETVDRTVLDL